MSEWSREDKNRGGKERRQGWRYDVDIQINRNIQIDRQVERERGRERWKENSGRYT